MKGRREQQKGRKKIVGEKERISGKIKRERESMWEGKGIKGRRKKEWKSDIKREGTF